MTVEKTHRQKKSDAIAVTSPHDEKHGYEFFGPPGVFVLTFGLPILVLASTTLCNDVSGCPAPALLDLKTLTLDKLKAQTPWPENGVVGLFDPEAIGWTVAYHGLLLVLQLLLPGTEIRGTELKTGGRHLYKFNSFSTALLVFAGLAAGTFLQGADFVVWTYIWDHFTQIYIANFILSTATSIWVYLRSFSVPHPGQPNPEHRELAAGGHSGNILYDFFIGRELNPRVNIPKSLPIIGGQVVDVKTFNEMRPGLIGWVILNLAYIAHQYKIHGFVTDSILFITAFQALYVMDALYMETAMLTTIDITTDGFGFMLAFGDYAWVPFIYSIQGRYLATYPLKLGITGIAGILAVQAVGYYIFRSSNNEKNRFRTDPNDPRVAHLESITTSSGSKLITSGWWGTSRHINYFGDWIMSWSYCLPTGIAGYVVNRYTNPVTGNVTTEIVQGDAKGWGMIFTYFYIVYFGVLLVHRQLRDDDKCAKKYGKDWDKYVQKVRWRIVPGLY